MKLVIEIEDKEDIVDVHINADNTVISLNAVCALFCGLKDFWELDISALVYIFFRMVNDDDGIGISSTDITEMH